MFNAVSREAARHVLSSHPQLHPLLPFIDLLYQEPNRCYFYHPDGTVDSFLQHEGFTQGCPLSPALAYLGRTLLTKQLNTVLQERAYNRQKNNHFPGDDGLSSLSASYSYIDDSFSFLPYTDSPLYIQHFTHLKLANLSITS